LAIKWNRAKRIICSTDSEEIAAVAKNSGIDVPFLRPKELASDKAGKVEVIRHALMKCEEIYNEKYDVVVDLDVSSPIKTKKDLDECLQLYAEKKPDILFSVTNARRNPYFNMVEINKQGYAELSKKGDTTILRSQDTPQVYDMNASIYFYSKSFLLDPKKRHPLSTDKAMIYLMDDVAAFDIDSEHDFKYIEYLIQNKVVSL
jgi:CMP-N-acetylneuraminic acid synthetase